ncbi:MAG: hypothetical protein M3346_04390 [Actinomycetota bacterium]|nr:hypothetical protein [Actinomycetota bacterium]
MEQLVELQPDLAGLQEVRRFFPRQARWIAEEANTRLTSQPKYAFHRTDKTGLWRFWEGIAVLTRLPILERDWLDLKGDQRVASFIRVGLHGGRTLDAYNTHLSSRDETLRTSQARRLLDWMDKRSNTPQVLVGDFNARPGSAPIEISSRNVFTQPMQTSMGQNLLGGLCLRRFGGGEQTTVS